MGIYKKTLYFFFIVSIFFIFPITKPSFAEVEKIINVNSEPKGADVFLLQGRKETLIGTTPFKYEAKFHSDKSILRLKLKRAGYDEMIVKVKATDDKIFFRLESFQYTYNPQNHTNKKLRTTQNQINPIIDKNFSKLIQKKGHFEYQLDGPIKAIFFEDKPFASIAIKLGDINKMFSTKGKENQKRFLEAVWQQFGDSLVLPLARHLDGKAVEGIILQVSFDDSKQHFSVSSHVETKTEMICVPGHKLVSRYDPCAQINSYTGGCTGGSVLQSVYDPCLNKVPRVKTTTVLDPLSSTTSGNASVSFSLPSEQFKRKSIKLNELSFVLKNTQGKILLTENSL